MTKQDFDKQYSSISTEIATLYKKRTKLEKQYVKDCSILKNGDIINFERYNYVITGAWNTAAGIRYEARELTASGHKKKWTWNYDPNIQFNERDIEKKQIIKQ